VRFNSRRAELLKLDDGFFQPALLSERSCQTFLRHDVQGLESEDLSIALDLPLE